MRFRIKNVVKNIVNGLFPPCCRGCGATGEYLCDRCKKYISGNLKPRKVTENASGVWAEHLGFRDEILGELVEEAKYESVRGLIPEVAEVIYEGYFKKKYETEIILVPMPTSRQHVRERAMDHMEMIARELERLSGGKIKRTRLLDRAKDTVQTGANEAVRRKQAKEAVRLNKRFVGRDGKVLPEFREKGVILIDDVWTTGASMMEAGKMLSKAGVSCLKLVAITKSRAKRSPALRHGEIY